MSCTEFSILTPSLEQGRFIGETLGSVRRQKDPSYEHLVMDAGSTDETLSILQACADDPHLRWWSEPDRGQAHALNKLRDRAGGELIGWLNSDDCYCLGALSLVRQAFDAHREVLVVFGDYLETDAHSRVLRARHAYEDGVESFIMFWEGRANIGQPAVFWRRELTERIGRFDESLHDCMDWDYWVRARRLGPFLHLPASLATCRLHAGAKTARINQARETVRHVGKYIDWLPPEMRDAARAKLAARQAWQDVQERASTIVFRHLAAELARRAGMLRTLVLYGCGLNARRLSGLLVPWADEHGLPLRWADDRADNPYLYWVPRVEAIERAVGGWDGLLVLVTPWDDAAMVRRLESLGGREGRTFIRWRELFARSEPATDVPALMEAAYA